MDIVVFIRGDISLITDDIDSNMDFKKLVIAGDDVIDSNHDSEGVIEDYVNYFKDFCYW